MDKPKDQKEEELTPAQSALLAQVGQVDAVVAPEIKHDGQGNLIEGEEEKADPTDENRALLTMLLSMIDPALPFLKDVYTPEKINVIAAAYTAVEEKYGWNVRGMMGPEVVLALVTIPSTIQAVALGRVYFAQQAKAREEAERQGAADGNK
jgi:hypothetical protein